ncbi:MAG: hypothetical protein GY856_09440 [bacterium]|nr:hypothetical protein [bacterium]
MRSTCVLMGWLLAAALCGAEQLPAGSAGESGSVPQSRAQADGPSRLANRVAELEARNAELERLVTLRASEVERYRAGLAQAVAELNRLRGEAALMPPADSVHRPSLRHGRGLVPSVPSVELAGKEALVRGEVSNSGRQTLRGLLTIELLRDGRSVDTARYRVEIPPHSSLPYAHRFALTGYAAGSYAARAGLER